MVKLGLRACCKGKQIPPFRKLEGWSKWKSLYPSIASLGSSMKSKSLKRFRQDKRYQIDGHLKRPKFARVWESFLPKHCLNFNVKRTRSTFTHPAHDLPQYPMIAWWYNSYKACKNLKFSCYQINAWKWKLLKNLWDRKHKTFQAIMEKSCLKKITAFNYTKTFEQTYARSILIAL